MGIYGLALLSLLNRWWRSAPPSSGRTHVHLTDHYKFSVASGPTSAPNSQILADRRQNNTTGIYEVKVASDDHTNPNTNPKRPS